MMLPSWRDWIFSVKTFAGAMLALWIALRMDLDRPYWAMATAYIVAQPFTGMMRSKAAYRFCGTMLGAVVTLVFIPNLVDAPVLLIAALSLWIGACIYFAVLDRTPRSYVFLLAGYSVALIGFPDRGRAGHGVGCGAGAGRGDHTWHCLHHVDRQHRLSDSARPRPCSSVGQLDSKMPRTGP